MRVLISSGPTREPIDPVRFVSNYSTGYMGAQLATEALARGHRVTVVSGPSTEPLPSGAQVIPVERAHEMERALRQRGRRADVIIMAAAVSDFRTARPASTKLPRLPAPRTSRRSGARQAGRRYLNLRLQQVPEIVGRLPRRGRQLVAGFALEMHRPLSAARRKLRDKRLDVLLAQDASLGLPFGRRKVRAWLLERGGEVTRLGELSKTRVARALLDKLEALWYGQSGSVRPRNGKR